MKAIKRGISGAGLALVLAVLLMGMMTGCAEQPTALVEIDSTMFSHVGYNPASQDLTVVFRDAGETYVYHNVPAEVHTGLVTAESAGRYFHTNIRDTYEYTRAE